MKCQMLNCESEALLWAIYDGDLPGYAMCQSCAERGKKFSEAPNKFSTRPLKPRVARLLQSLDDKRNKAVTK